MVTKPESDGTTPGQDEQIEPLQEKQRGRYRTWMLPALLVLITVSVYANGLNGDFVFDDKPAIVDNPGIRIFSGIFTPLGNQEARPVVFASLALNYALGELQPLGYHVFNLLVHLLAMLTLWAVVRSTLRLPTLRTRFARASHGVAFAIALLWSLHPMQAECVSYVFQRGESMQALFYMLAIFGYIRGATSHGLQRAAWIASVLIASVLGMGCKASFISLPATLLLFDSIFLRPSFAGTNRHRGALIAVVTIVVVAMGVTTIDLHEMVAEYWEPTPPEDVAFSIGYATTPIEYIRSQPTVILRYLGLAFWPDKLSLDYWLNPVDSVPQIVLTSAALMGLLVLTGIALWRKPTLGFCPAFVFLVLLPTTLYWKMELMFTYRMYLPLAGLVSFVVFAGYGILGRLRPDRLSRKVARGIGVGGLILVAGAMSARTIFRNTDFQDQYTMYRSVVATVPENPRGHFNLANRLMDRYQLLKKEGRNEGADRTLQEAIRHYREAVRYFPKYVEANINLAIALGLEGNTDELIERLEQVVSWDPEHLAALYNLAQASRKRGIVSLRSGHRNAARRDLEVARSRFTAFLAEKPSHPDAVFGLGTTLYFLGRYDEAEKMIRRYLTLEPSSDLGKAYLKRILSPPTLHSHQRKPR